VSDPTLEAALAYSRQFQQKPSLLRRLWHWYKKATGYEAAVKATLWREYMRVDRNLKEGK
jgi:hypothetical protein